MVSEIKTWGPITCAMRLSKEFTQYKNGVFVPQDGDETTDDLSHVVEIIGFGEENDVKFWEVKNTWGEAWGNGGYFKIVRSIDALGIESECVWGNVNATDIEMVKNLDYQIMNKDNRTHEVSPETEPFNNIDVQGSKTFLPEFEEPNKVIQEKTKEWMHGEFKDGDYPTIRASDLVDTDELPDYFFWGDIDGVNYLSMNKNEYQPRDCLSAWAQAPTVALADRFNILTKNTFPSHNIAVQPELECHLGNCTVGGWPLKVYALAHSHGLPDLTCSQYEATYPNSSACTPFSFCNTCMGPIPSSTETSTCQTVENPKYYYTSHYGFIKPGDLTEMMAQVYKFGPITCALDATKQFQQLEGWKIFEQLLPGAQFTHMVSLVGWGEENGVPYWIGRNSWGTYWGENGFFRIVRGNKDKNLDLEAYCSYGIPSWTKVENDGDEELGS